MKLLTVTSLLGFGLSAAGAFYLYQENASLRSQLAEQSTASQPVVVCEPEEKVVIVTETRPEKPKAPEEAPQSAPSDGPPRRGDFRSRLDRRRRGQTMIATMLGRHEGETEDEYRARMVPFLTDRLAEPRQELEAFRDEAFSAAKIDDEQRKALDDIVQRSFEEAIDLANRAITDGDISPYQRNTSGFLSLAGSMGAVLGNTEAQIGKVLSAEQRKALDDIGFDWAEYMAVQAPWETLTPPPPPPKP